MAALYDTDTLRAQVQYQRGAHIFDALSDGSALTGPVRYNPGDIDWVGGVVMGKVSSFNLFLSAAQSQTHPNDQQFQVDAGPADLMHAADGRWTSKLGTRGNVYEVYVIQSSGTSPSQKMDRPSSNSVISPVSSAIQAATTGSALRRRSLTCRKPSECPAACTDRKGGGHLPNL